MVKDYGDVCFLDATFKVTDAGYDIMEIVFLNEAKQQIVVGYVSISPRSTSSVWGLFKCDCLLFFLDV